MNEPTLGTIIDEQSTTDRMRDFSALLQNIKGLDDKKKRLWLEIYSNAITDRQNAYAVFTQLVRIAEDKSSEHAVHGRTIASFIERMSKANDQLIKLAELVAKADEEISGIDPDEIFRKINERN